MKLNALGHVGIAKGADFGDFLLFSPHVGRETFVEMLGVPHAKARRPCSST